MSYVFMDVIDPTMNAKAEKNDKESCIMLEIKMGTNDTVNLHFNNLQDLQAFAGLLNIVSGRE